MKKTNESIFDYTIPSVFETGAYAFLGGLLGMLLAVAIYLGVVA